MYLVEHKHHRDKVSDASSPIGKYCASIHRYQINYACVLDTTSTGVEIDDERAEKIFTAQDAIEFLKKEMDVH